MWPTEGHVASVRTIVVSPAAIAEGDNAKVGTFDIPVVAVDLKDGVEFGAKEVAVRWVENLTTRGHGVVKCGYDWEKRKGFDRAMCLSADRREIYDSGEAGAGMLPWASW